MDQQLWERIEAFNFDEPFTEYCFTIRLEAENKRTRNFAAKAILEYKRGD